MPSHHLAIDLGAESGRLLVGTLDHPKLIFNEIHRFPTGASSIGGTLRWDILRIFDEIKTGLAKAGKEFPQLASVSTDSWGVDYLYTSPTDPVLNHPFHYRDSRTDGALERAFAKVSKETIFAETGLQFMPFNTVYQWADDVAQRPKLVAAAQCTLLIADAINFLLSGRAVAEASLASTTQLFHPGRQQWSKTLIEKLGLESIPLPEIVPSGTRLGPLRPDLQRELNLGPVEVIATCSHDTGAAVAAVPGRGDQWAYLSSGTWSLLGLELPEPNFDPAVLAANFTNEVGYGGSIRFLKNIVGLWIVQECRRAWEIEGQSFTYAELTELAAAAPPLAAWIDPRDDRFAKPGNMPDKIRTFCSERGQTPPASHGAIIRCVLESLALLYRRVLDQAESLTGRTITSLHIVGGGSKNRLLNQFTANATGRQVRTGPVEATAIGNLLLQALALGHLRSLAELREVVDLSSETETYRPTDQNLWEVANARFAP